MLPKQFTTPEIRERKRQPQSTYTDHTANYAVANVTAERKQKLQRNLKDAPHWLKQARLKNP